MQEAGAIYRTWLPATAMPGMREIVLAKAAPIAGAIGAAALGHVDGLGAPYDGGSDAFELAPVTLPGDPSDAPNPALYAMAALAAAAADGPRGARRAGRTRGRAAGRRAGS